MARSFLVSLAPVVLTMQISAAPSHQQIGTTENAGTRVARHFLEVFASDPVASEALVTGDAVLIEGDVGGNFSFYAPEVERSAKQLGSCKVVSLQLVAASGESATYSGGYSCDGPNGTKKYVPLSITLLNGRVSKFWISWLD